MESINQNKLKKIKKEDFFDIKDFNDNMDKLDFLFEDTGWIDTGISFEGTVYAGAIQYRKIGNEVYLKGGFSAFPDQVSVILPKEIIPKYTQKFKDVDAAKLSNEHLTYNFVMTTDILINNTGKITFECSYAGESIYGGPKGVSLDGIRYLLN